MHFICTINAPFLSLFVCIQNIEGMIGIDKVVANTYSVKNVRENLIKPHTKNVRSGIGTVFYYGLGGVV